MTIKLAHPQLSPCLCVCSIVVDSECHTNPEATGSSEIGREAIPKMTREADSLMSRNRENVFDGDIRVI